MKYNATITEHFDHPRNQGVLRGANAVGEADNPVCLDRVRLFLRVKQGVVSEASFQAEGCVPTIAAADVVAGYLGGKTVEEAARLDPNAVEQLLGGLPSTKKHAAHVVVEALRTALGLREHE